MRLIFTLLWKAVARCSTQGLYETKDVFPQRGAYRLYTMVIATGWDYTVAREMILRRMTLFSAETEGK